MCEYLLSVTCFLYIPTRNFSVLVYGVVWLFRPTHRFIFPLALTSLPLRFAEKPKQTRFNAASQIAPPTPLNKQE